MTVSNKISLQLNCDPEPFKTQFYLLHVKELNAFSRYMSINKFMSLKLDLRLISTTFNTKILSEVRLHHENIMHILCCK